MDYLSDATCRICGKENVASVDIFKVNNLIQRFLPIQVSETDPLPKQICFECDNQIEFMHQFALNALEVQKNLWIQYKQITASCFKKPGIRITNPVSLTQMKTRPVKSKVTQTAVSDALRKLNASCLTVKKVVEAKKPVKKPKMEMIQYEEEEIFDYDFPFKTAEVIIKEEPHLDSEEADDLGGDSDYEPSTRKKTKRQPKDKTTAKKSTDKVIQLDCPAVYVCMNCKGRYKSFKELRSHMDTSRDCIDSSLKCEVCGKVCQSRKQLYNHKISHAPKESHMCDKCGKAYSNSFNLENHKSQIHGEDIDEIGCIYKCKDCDGTFENRKDLYKHMEDHKNEVLNLLCDTCGKCFHSVESMRSHQRVHLDIRPFVCDVCTKRFRTRLLLIQHSHVHTGVKLFKCDQCGKAFAKKGSLRMHYRQHSVETTFVCSFCALKCESYADLRVHYATHKNQLPPKTPQVRKTEGNDEYEILFITE